MVAVRRSSPTLELAEIFEFQIVKLDEFSEIQRRLFVAVIERGEFSRVRAAVSEFDVGLVPVLKREFAIDAFVMSDGDRGDDIRLTVPYVLLIDLNLCGARKGLRWHFRWERDGELVLCVREPRAAAIVHDDVPFVPAALFVFIQDAAGDDERFVFVNTFGVELNG